MAFTHFRVSKLLDMLNPLCLVFLVIGIRGAADVTAPIADGDDDGKVRSKRAVGPALGFIATLANILSLFAVEKAHDHQPYPFVRP